jgi:ketosteroid isomerase-like protein
MSESLVREMFATIDARDWSRLDRYFTADVVYERPGYTPVSGLPALLDFYQRTRIIAAGRHDLWQVIADATGRPAGDASSDKVATVRCSTSALLTSTCSSPAGSPNGPHISSDRRSDRPSP